MQVIKTIDVIRDWSVHKKITCIYKITNLNDGKIYIGQTLDFRKRVSAYHHINPKIHPNRSIVKAINAEGSDNFSIEIIQRCEPEQLNALEKKYIEFYKASNHKYGYNDNNGLKKSYNLNASKNKSISHTGIKESEDTKRKKSNTIIAICPETYTVIIADSGKLFGDYIGKGKDYIKNCLRQPSSVNGYFLYYMDYEKRLEMKFKMLKKRSIRNVIYMDLLTILNNYNDTKYESVETIYHYLKKHIGNIYELKYENINENNELFLSEIKFDNEKCTA